MALYQYRQLLVYGPKGFASSFSHGGIEPFYPPGPSLSKVDYLKLRVDAEVLRTRHAGVDGKWYFSTRNDATAGQLLGFEIFMDRDEDPCEVYLSDYRKWTAARCRTASRSAMATRPTRIWSSMRGRSKTGK